MQAEVLNSQAVLRELMNMPTIRDALRHGRNETAAKRRDILTTANKRATELKAGLPKLNNTYEAARQALFDADNALSEAKAKFVQAECELRGAHVAIDINAAQAGRKARDLADPRIRQVREHCLDLWNAARGAFRMTPLLIRGTIATPSRVVDGSNAEPIQNATTTLLALIRECDELPETDYGDDAALVKTLRDILSRADKAVATLRGAIAGGLPAFELAEG